MIDSDLNKISLSITQEQDDFLKTLSQNKSVAVRMLIDNMMKMKGKVVIDRSLLYLLLIIFIGIIALLIIQMW
jgi:hypothetical protein